MDTSKWPDNDDIEPPTEFDLIQQYNILADRTLDDKALSIIEDEAFGVLLSPYFEYIKRKRIFKVRNAVLVNTMLTQTRFSNLEKASLKLLYRFQGSHSASITGQPKTVREALAQLENEEQPLHSPDDLSCRFRQFLLLVIKLTVEKYAFFENVHIVKADQIFAYDGKCLLVHPGNYIIVTCDIAYPFLCVEYFDGNIIFVRKCRSSLECFVYCRQRLSSKR